LKKRYIFTWSRVRRLKIDLKFSEINLFKKLKIFANILVLKFFNVNFFKTKVSFFIFKNKIIYIKIFNFFWKLSKIFSGFYFNPYLNKINFYSNTGFFFFDYFFFKLKIGYLKFKYLIICIIKNF
jgi:hypothetical protein